MTNWTRRPSLAIRGASQTDRLGRSVAHLWQTRNALSFLLLPLSWLFLLLVESRRIYYTRRNRLRARLPVPVIVVGNLTVGGTGKTPLVIWLCEFLKSQGFKPGVIGRGYKGLSKSWPQPVTSASDPVMVGDEPVLIAARSVCPVVVGPDRVADAQVLLDRFDCDVLIADDGLQHYALIRDIEIVVVDGVRRFGNGYCLPAGPLREPVRRLNAVDFVVVNGKADNTQYGMTFRMGRAVNLCRPQTTRSLKSFVGTPINALAGIGNPDRFYKMLRNLGMIVTEYSFPDHHRYSPKDLQFNDGRPVLMTEKDAVKLKQVNEPNFWYVPVTAVPEDPFSTELINTLRDRQHGQQIARYTGMSRHQRTPGL